MCKIQISDDQEPRGFVFAPCTHDLPCPHKATETKKQCKVGQRAELSLAEQATGLKSRGYNLEKFSYIVLKKGNRPTSVEGANIHRIVEPERKRTRHVVCKLCTQDGNLMQTVVSKSKGK
jgi:ribosomal protein RSM22 (predicted rRNA methylase)